MTARPATGRARPADDRVAIVSCHFHRAACVAVDAAGARWTMQLGSEPEAESMARAILLRGNIKPKFWRRDGAPR
jgi:hypothetical protein